VNRSVRSGVVLKDLVYIWQRLVDMAVYGKSDTRMAVFPFCIVSHMAYQLQSNPFNNTSVMDALERYVSQSPARIRR